MVLAITVNGEAKGEFFVFQTPEGDHFVRTADLAALGLADAKGRTIDIDGEPHLALESVSGIRPRLDEKTLTLELSAAPALLGRKTFDLAPPRRRNVLRPENNSAFVNYRLGYASAGGGSSYTLTGQAGARLSGWLLLTDFSHVTSTPGEAHTVRLQSSATFDRPRDLQRLVIGDFFTTSGDLGSALNLGGLSFSKRYSIDPYLVRQPMADLQGVVATPANAEVYIDGMRVRTEKLPPGQFSLENLSYYGGARNIDIVIKDGFGGQQHLSYRYYFTDALLREGLQEYSYDVGSLRRDFGIASNRYGPAAFSAFHRYGFSNNLTLGLRAEGAEGRRNFGPEGALRLGPVGVLSIRLATSRDTDGTPGRASQFNYAYQAGAFSARLSSRHLSSRYVLALPSPVVGAPRTNSTVGFGYGTPRTGNFSVDMTSSSFYDDVSRRAVTVSYSKSIGSNFNLFAALSRVREGGSRTEFFAGLSWYPSRDSSASYFVQNQGGTHADMLQFSKNPPLGEGWSYRIAAERDRSVEGGTTSVSPYVQYNGPHGIYTAEYRAGSIEGSGATSSYDVSMAGAISYVGGFVNFSRPVEDSYGVVRVGDVGGVRVYQNNEVIGRTRPDGTLFLPNLGSYVDNQVSIEDRDVPFNYAIAEKERYVSPPLRSGSLIAFPVTRIQAFMGKIRVVGAGAAASAEYYEATLTGTGKPIPLPTGKDGDFYVENLAPGTYTARMPLPDGACGFRLQVPVTDEPIVDLGEIACEPIR